MFDPHPHTPRGDADVSRASSAPSAPSRCRREGALAAMENLAATAYPALTTRPHRGAVATLDGASVAACQALCYKDCLLWPDAAGTLHGGGYQLAGFDRPPMASPRQLVTMGAYLCVFPR